MSPNKDSTVHNNGEFPELRKGHQKEMKMNRVREKIELSQKQIVKEIQEELNHLERELLNEVHNTENGLSSTFNNNLQTRRKTDKSLPEKIFLARNSVLTDLFEVNHILTIYHIFIAILIVLTVNILIEDIITRGTINLGFSTLYWNFSELPTVLTVWCGMMVSTLSVYYMFDLWAEKRITILTKRSFVKAWDIVFILLLVSYQLLFLVIPCSFVFCYQLPFACSIAVLMEQLRLLMKSHAFIRSNTPRVLRFKTDKPKMLVPPFSKYLYFLFCPTLVYKDEYPRTNTIRWRVVLYNFIDVIACIFYISFIGERSLLPASRNLDIKNLRPQQIVLSVFGAMVPALLTFVCCFYLLLHSWMNAFAEMLRFSDRLFYKDWWNSSSFAQYYRTWNIVVHDWLYTYIYKDFIDNVIQHKGLGTWLVFITSAFFHEYILAVAFGFFYPCLFVIFGFFGTGLMFIPKLNDRGGNIMVWLSLIIGTGLLSVLYEVEYRARTECPGSIDSPFFDFITPRSWQCLKMAE